MHRARVLALPAVALLCTACPAGDGSTTGPSSGTPSSPTTPPTTPTTPATPPVATAASVSVTAPLVVVEVGKSIVVVAAVRDANGTAMSGRIVSWTSGAPSIATVDASGTVRGVAPGVAAITADVDGRSASVTITVYATPAGNVVLTPQAATVTGAQTSQSGLAVLACTFQWSATMTGSGSVVALENTYTVQSPGGTTTTKTETITSSSGGALTLSPAAGVTFQKSLSWQAVLGSASAQQGFTMTLALTYTEQPTGTRRATAPIVVACLPSVSAAVGVSVSPAAASLAVGQTQPLSATVTNALNTNVSWSSSATNVATVSAAGVVTAVAPGMATITATSAADPTRSASAVVTVTSASSPPPAGPPSGSASFMSARLLTPPNMVADEHVIAMTATNAGIYLLYASDARDRVVHFETGGSLTSGWLSFAPAFGITSFAPSHLTLERPGTFSGYWVQDVFSCSYPENEQVGLWELNTGVPSLQWTNDVCAERVIPSSSEDVNLRHTWLVATQHGSVSQPLGGFYVEQAAKQGANALSSDYKKVADLVDHSSVATSPKDNALWVGALNRLYEITESGTRRTYDLSAFGPGIVEYLRFDGATLWFQFGGTVMRYQGGTFKRYASATTMPGVRQFCVRGSTIYLTGGTKVDATTGVATSYIADRELGQLTSQTDITTYMGLFQKTVGAIECSPATSGSVLYVSTTSGLYEVTPK